MKKEDKLRRPIKLRNFRIWSGLSNLRRNVSLSAIFLIQLGVGEAKLSGKLNCWALHKFNTYNKREINCWWLLLSSWRCLQVSVSFLWTVGEISPVKLFWSAICLEEQNGVWRRDTPKGEILLCHHSSCDQLMYVYLMFFRPPIHTAVLPGIPELSLLLILGIVLELLDTRRIMSTLAGCLVVFPPLQTILLHFHPNSGAGLPKRICFVPFKMNQWDPIKMEI